MNRTYPSENVWSIILAGGDGEWLGARLSFLASTGGAGREQRHIET